MIETLEAPVTAPLETVTPIKPSEAIRLGCLTTTPTTGSFFDGHGGACALGAMAIGFGYDGPRNHVDDHGPDESDPYDLIAAHLTRLPVPVGTEYLYGITAESDPASVIYALNDSEGWSRERIADWLEGLGL